MRRIRALFVAAAVGLAGCGADTATQGGAASSTASASDSTSAANSVVPNVDLVDVATGQTVSLRSKVATDKPTLLWMWAPS